MAAKKGRACKAGVEVGVTISVTREPPQFVRYTFTLERIVPSDDEETILRYERMMNKTVEEVVQRRAHKFARLMLSMSAEAESGTLPRRRRKSSGPRGSKGVKVKKEKTGSPYPYD